MTLIEFFDENRIENVACALLSDAKRVILVGSSPSRLAQYCTRYTQLSGKPYEPRSIDRNDLGATVKTLEKIVCEVSEAGERCVLELAGGDDLCLVAAGIVAERHPDQIDLWRTNIPHSRLDVFYPENQSRSSEQCLTLEENVRIYGGRLQVSEAWDLEKTEPIARLLWQLTLEQKDWNHHVEQLGRLRASFPVDGNNQPVIDEKKKATALRFGGKISDLRGKFGRGQLDEIVELLQKIRRRQGEDKYILRELQISEQELYVEYADGNVKRLLDKAGQVLEVWLAGNLKKMTRQRTGRPYFCDICVGAELDWDGVIQPHNFPDVSNEIDVMAMRGMVPVFISCKSGKVKPEELYKLDHVAARFGGDYAKKILVVRSLGPEANSEISFEQRAAEMGIAVLELEEMITSGGHLNEAVLWSKIQKICEA
ncbi:MAG: hypothetical protein IJN42_02270 [Clostridia bacterium]|nr:hypothetical protein [Clostridia bacterium]